MTALADIQDKAGSLEPDELVAAVQFAKDAAAAMPGKTASEVLREALAASALQKEFPDKPISLIYEAAKAWDESIKNLPLQPGEKPSEGLQRVIRENANLRGQNVELSKRIEAEKKGNMFPSCWATPEGKEEAIFDIVYNESGIEVTVRPLPHRDADRALLPIRNVRYKQILSPAEFRSDLMDLYRWSVKENCRFHVVLFTRGKMERSHQNAVNAFFYPASSIQAR